MRGLATTVAAMVLAAGFALPGAANERPLDPASIAGVYKTRFKNGLVSGETYTSENVLEIVKLAPDAAYVRARLNFFNGHLCAIHGVAHVEEHELVYRGPLETYPGAERCVLRVAVKGKSLALADGSTCSAYCGARGMFNNAAFPTASRRPIRYMTRLKASREFAAAVTEDDRGRR
jgi:hypothetical protein